MRKVSFSGLACAVAAACGALACGPTQVHLDPKSVAAVSLKLATPAPSFCPGQPIRFEVRAQLQDGSTCSSNDTSTVCMGEKGALIDPADLRLQGSAGDLVRSPDALLWVPPKDALVTAEKGLSLRAWVESNSKGTPARSPVGQVELRPEYQCLRENVFSLPPPAAGENGGPGPNIKVAATTFSTPYYPEALLVRVDHPGGRTYIISPERSQPITVVSKGQPGGAGQRGGNGANGADGADGSSRICEAGKPGTNGTDGQPGMPGGNGGPGGAVELLLDEAVTDKVQGWLRVGSVGGDGGAGGRGGGGGVGGRGGMPSDVQMCSAPTGASGKTGNNAPDGQPGVRGQDGPPATVTTASRKALFGEDLATIERIEAAARAKR